MANLDFCDKNNIVAYLQKSEGSAGFHQIVDFLNTCHIKYALIENPTLYVSLIEQFWQTASASKLEMGKSRKLRFLGLVSPYSKPSSRLSVASQAVYDRHGGAVTTVSGLEAGQGSGNIHKTPTMPYDSPLPRVHKLGSDEGRMQPNELMELVTKLSDRVAVLENDLKQTKKTYGDAFTKLIKKGRKIAEIDEDPNIFLVQQMIHHDAQTQGRQEYDLEPNFEFTAPEEVYTVEPDISTAGAEVSTAAESLVYIRRSAAKRKDKGKAIVEESEPTQTKTKIQQEQERLGFEEAQRLQEQFDEEERQRIASVHEKASTFKPEEWDNIKAQIEADEELAHMLQA
ncbi:hypothetical protein Tco_1516235 [Tanacetum coccineum]